MKVYDYPRERRAVELRFRQSDTVNVQLERTVQKILADVRELGDSALLDYTEKFDSRRLTAKTLRVDAKVCKRAWEKLPADVARAMEFARDGIEAFHRKQLRGGFVMKRGGAKLEQRVTPLNSVGVYVPGGRASYPSTMLMNVIPALVAGVKQIVVCTPPVSQASEDFAPFAAAHLLGVTDLIFQVGGAQAVAAMAYGTKTIPKVDKVVGPGNAYVAWAKKSLYGTIDIDSVAGESEVLIIADTSADPEYVAADLIAQAEHTGGETVVLIGIGRSFSFTAVDKALKSQLAKARRRVQAEQSLKQGGIFIRVPDRETAAKVANLKAPEHMEILTTAPEELVPLIPNVGAVFVGPYTPEPIGDYVAGPNHVLPTGGTARFFSPLGTADFLKTSNVLTYDEAAFRKAAPHVVALAECEGLSGHADAVRVRLSNGRAGKGASATRKKN